MKKPDQDEIDKELESDPLTRKGFTPQLQRRIEEAVDRQERAKPRLKPFWIIAGASAVVAAVLIFPWDSLHPKSDNATAVVPAVADQTDSVLSSPPPISTAVLIGLRTEHEEKDSSRTLGAIRYNTYRTMLVAPVRGQLRKTSEGSGILMPYKQNFWKIDSLVHKTKTDEYHYLSAHLADQPAKTEQFEDDPGEELHHVETLVFAGNQYLSVAESEEVWHGNAPYQSDRVWVRTLPQLKEGRTTDFINNRADTRHVSLTDLYGDGISNLLGDLSSKRQMTDLPTEISGESWTIVRSPGHWIAKAAETFAPKVSLPDRYILHDFPRALPEKVVNHDTLFSAWNDIKSYWPNATDALASPMNDMLVIFEQGKLKFFPYGQAPNNDPLLTVDLEPGEQLVMAQWATDHYVQDWVDKVGAYLNAAEPQPASN